MKDGILNINKPAGMTSHDVIGDLRRLLGMKKIGHTGTLDPMATGVLPICLGKATRVAEYMDMDFKTYRCTMSLGVVTDTQDIWGEVLELRDTTGITEAAVRAAFMPFRGEISQLPPMYSAVRIDGRRLYDYARAGETDVVADRVQPRRVYSQPGYRVNRFCGRQQCQEGDLCSRMFQGDLYPDHLSRCRTGAWLRRGNGKSLPYRRRRVPHRGRGQFGCPH